MHDRDLLRYSRHILLNEFGIESQVKLGRAHALVIGAGGLGSAALMYLASAGVGSLTIADGDDVDLTNLQRQVVHREATIGINKAVSAEETLRGINADIHIAVVPRRLAGDELDRLVAAADVVLDCTDNFQTRHAVNAACVAHRVPLVSGAGIRFDGQIASFDFRLPGVPCYHCLFPDVPDAEEERCAVMGVFAPLVGIVGAMQAAEAICLLAGIGEALSGRLQMFDARAMTWQTVRFGRDDSCVVCAKENLVPQREAEHAI